MSAGMSDNVPRFIEQLGVTLTYIDAVTRDPLLVIDDYGGCPDVGELVVIDGRPRAVRQIVYSYDTAAEALALFIALADTEGWEPPATS